MAFHKMLWVRDKSDFKVKVKVKIRKAAKKNVQVTVSIRNAS